MTHLIFLEVFSVLGEFLIDLTMSVRFPMSEITNRLAQDAAEIDNALAAFMSERSAEVDRQKKAEDAYAAEMEEIERDQEALGLDEAKSTVDHNMMRHLNITKYSSEKDDFDEFNRVREEEEYTRRFEPGYVDEPVKVEFDKGLVPKPPPPNPEEKAAIREQIFSLLDESKAEEMHLELQYEKLRDEVGAFKAEHLAEGLFTVQKANYAKLKDKLEEYQPQGFGKAWGNDPDYIAIMKELQDKLGAAEIAHAAEKKKGKKKKKAKGGH